MTRSRTTMCPVVGSVSGQGDGFWVNVDTCDKIIALCPNPQIPHGLYIALNRIASDRQSARFEVSSCYVGSHAGVSKAATLKGLAELARIGAIKFEPSEKGRDLVQITLLGEVRL